VQQLNDNDEIRNAVARKIFKSKTGREYPISSASAGDKRKFNDIQIKLLVSVLFMLSAFWKEVDSAFTRKERQHLTSRNEHDREYMIGQIAIKVQKLSDEMVRNGYIRAQFTSERTRQLIRD